MTTRALRAPPTARTTQVFERPMWRVYFRSVLSVHQFCEIEEEKFSLGNFLGVVCCKFPPQGCVFCNGQLSRNKDYDCD